MSELSQRIDKLSNLQIPESSREIWHPTADTTLSIEDQIVFVKTTGADTGVTITLPPVKQAQGKIVSVYMTARDTADVTLEDNSGDAGLSDITLDAADEYSILWSNGYMWFEIASNHA